MPSGRTKISLKSGHGLGHVTPTIFGCTFGYPSDSLASCLHTYYTFISTRNLKSRRLHCKFLFNYLQFWRSYAIL